MWFSSFRFRSGFPFRGSIGEIILSSFVDVYNVQYFQVITWGNSSEMTKYFEESLSISCKETRISKRKGGGMGEGNIRVIWSSLFWSVEVIAEVLDSILPYWRCLLSLNWTRAKLDWTFSGDALHQVRQALTDPMNVLQSWDPSLVNPCTWFHVTCSSENTVIRV